ncbi:GGDEF domain-containing protein [Colwellia sp. Arc7-D]|uniref:tetratricopeptide repeat-containing diguanylate cyclase n=1 Tax=Colwellia sp. Arc7-D TaxID=2161872 RepID=UPI000D37976F|nr:GGDEF domain-containing protein [Colwellia sp. Arc7-D]AWB57049.1 hypothetical protein DBO93_05425 [Colwellia sp. Arc7-D]
MQLILRFSFLSLFFYSLNSYSLNIVNKIEEIKLISNNEIKTEMLLKLFKNKQLGAKARFLVLDTLTLHHYSQGNLNDALSLAKQSLGIAQEFNLIFETGKALKNIGIMHYLKADIDIAIESYKQALIYFNVREYPIPRANVLNNIALAFIKKTDLIDALEYFKQASFLYKNHGTTVDSIDVKFNMAGLYIRLGHATNSIEMLNEVIKERLLLKDTKGVFMAYADLVIALKSNEQFNEALSISHKVIIHYRDRQDNYNLSAALHNISDVYMKISEPLLAKKYALEGLEFAKKSNHNQAYIGSFYTLSKAQIALGEINEAFETIQKSNKHIKTLKNETLLTVNDGIHSLVLMAKGQSSKAIEIYQKYLVGIRKTHSEKFNNQLVKFESNQLKQKLLNLKNQEKLNLLESENESKFKNIMIMFAAFIISIIFLLYKKIMDKRIKQSLEQQVNNRTIELKEANEKLLGLSYLDGLTEINNRRCFDDDIKSLWDKKENSNNKFHILIADIDFFKLYNDSYGHVAGDKALIKVSEVLKNNVRENDKVYRYGGEEFAILFSNCNFEIAVSASQRILETIHNIKIPHADSEFEFITLSAGISTFDLTKMISIEDFINQADQKLYKAKESGKNQLCWV